MVERLYTLKKLLGVTTRTIQRWDEEGKIKVVRTIGGRRRIPEGEIKRILGLKEERMVVGYARVSSSTQRDDLDWRGRSGRYRAMLKGGVMGKSRYFRISVLGSTGKGGTT